MMKKAHTKGFTLIELVMIIVILGILAAVAVPQFFDLTSDAQTAAESGVVGGVRAGIQTYFANNRAFPSALDAASAAACDTSNACFDTVLAQGGVTSDWTKANTTEWTGPASNTYRYTSSSGSFLQQ